MPVQFISEGDMKAKKIKQHNDIISEVHVAPVNEPVVVQSRKLNNAATTVRFSKFMKKGANGLQEERYLSRTYTFRDFKSNIPFKMAKQLVLDNMNDFTIISPVDESLTALQEKINTFNDSIEKKKAIKQKRYICDICKKEFVNHLLLGKHRKAAHTIDNAKLEESQKSEVIEPCATENCSCD